MKEILVDANVLVSFFTDRNPDQTFDDKLRKKLKKQSAASYWSD